jgi:copper(I)-binding protein
MAPDCTSLLALTQSAAITSPDSGIVMGRPKRAAVPGRSNELKRLLSAMLAFIPVSPACLAAEPAGLSLTDAWVRALPPGQPNTAAYLIATNRGAAAVTIIGASAAIAGEVQIHTTREVDGYQRMEQLTELQVAQGQSLAFAPGGTHLMLLGLTQMPAPGDEVRLCLQLAAGDEVCTLADVRKSAGAEQSHEHHQH